MRHADRRVNAAQRIFDDNTVALAAQDQADAGIVAGLAVAIIECSEIEIHLARMLGLEWSRLQIAGGQGAQPAVIEQQVDVEILAADLDMMLAGDEGEALAEFEQHVLDPGDQGAFDVALMRGAGSAANSEG
jgi:hypothetical protein